MITKTVLRINPMFDIVFATILDFCDKYSTGKMDLRRAFYFHIITS